MARIPILDENSNFNPVQRRVVDGINKKFGDGIANAVDARMIQVAAPMERDRRVEFGAARGAPLHRHLVAAPCRHVPVFIDMRGGPRGVISDCAVRQRQCDQRRRFP